MPKITLVLFQETNGRVPILNWLDGLSDAARDKCVASLELLRERGHELRRPIADCLQDQLYELRIKQHGVNYRIIYFFHGREMVVLSHGFKKKQSKVPPDEIRLAMKRRESFLKSPKTHTYQEERTA